ncbi:MAG TPA: hypothetical protein VFE58_09430 [Tepidisphaeraceae bacterium]|jgi:hypothetical protein|nr:hypothetical protein [Tepidisphaeraceae bacterium]
MARPKVDYPAHIHDKATHRGLVRLSGEKKYTGRWRMREAEDNYKHFLADWIARGR